MVARATRLAASATAAAVAALPAAAAAHSGHGPTNVAARGDALFGRPAFAPAKVEVLAGDTVRWTNAGDFAPHTATEDNGLWELTGTSTGLLGGARGFGPRETRERAFEAGTFAYHCAVHPTMKGTVAAAAYAYAESRILRRRRSRWYVVASWATTAPGPGLVFDTERRLAGQAWQAWKTGTAATKGQFRGGKRGRVWEVRSRLRRAADPSKASGWSPAARVVVG